MFEILSYVWVNFPICVIINNFLALNCLSHNLPLSFPIVVSFSNFSISFLITSLVHICKNRRKQCHFYFFIIYYYYYFFIFFRTFCGNRLAKLFKISLFNIKSINSIQNHPHILEWYSCILNMFYIFITYRYFN